MALTIRSAARAGLVLLASLTLAGSAVAGDLAEPDRRAVLVSVRDLLARADAALDSGAQDEARAGLGEAVALAETLGQPTLLLARAVDALADLERDAGRPAEAIGHYTRSVELFASLLGDGQPRLAVSLHNLGVLLLERGDPEQAVRRLRRAQEIWISSFGEDSGQARNTARALARVEAVSGSSSADAERPEAPLNDPPGRPAGGDSRPPR